MNRLLKTDAMKRLTKKIKNKRGATLVELIATIAILSIVASLSFEAMYMAAEEFRRVKSISECERSISLLQDNLNMYIKNASYIKLVDNSASGYTNVVTDMNVYKNLVSGNGVDYDNLEDAENVSTDKHIFIFLYRDPSKPFTYRLSKYTKPAGATPYWETIVTIDNIKEINFSLRQLQSSYDTKSWLLDYAAMSPTDFEMLYSNAGTLEADSLNTDEYSNTEGAYSVMTGTVINNKVEGTSASQLRMCENLPATPSGRPAYDGSRNFIVIKTVPREAK